LSDFRNVRLHSTFLKKSSLSKLFFVIIIQITRL